MTINIAITTIIFVAWKSTPVTCHLPPVTQARHYRTLPMSRMRGNSNDKLLESGLLDNRDQEEITGVFARTDSRLCERDLLDLLSLQQVQASVREGVPSSVPDFRLSVRTLWSYWPARSAMVLSGFCGCAVGIAVSFAVLVPMLYTSQGG